MERLIKLPEVVSVTGISRSEIYRLEAAGKFPRRVPLSERSVAWVEEEVVAWVKNKIAQREQATKARGRVGSSATARQAA